MKETLSAIHAGAYEAPAGKDFPPHQHNVWEVVYYRKGRIPCPIGDEIYAATPGTILLTPPNTMHSERAVTAYANWYFTVDAPADHPWPIVCHDDSHRTMGALFQLMVQEFQRPDNYGEQMIACTTQQLDLLFRRAHQNSQLSDAEQMVRDAELLIGQRFSSPLEVNDVAHSLGVSPSSLREKFARLRGQSPLEYLAQVRVNHALTLLHNSTQTLEAVANQSGFYSASHLSRHIKRATGKSPGQLRQRV